LVGRAGAPGRDSGYSVAQKHSSHIGCRILPARTSSWGGAGTRPAAYCPPARISASLANRLYHSARSRAMRFECKSGANRAGAQSAPACSGRYGVSCMMKATDISARPNAARCAGALLAFGAFRLETLSPTKRSTNPHANGFAANCPAQSDQFSSQSGGKSIPTASRLGHHRLRDRKLLGRFHYAAGAHSGEQDLQWSAVDGQPRFLRMHFPFFVTPLDLPCQPMHPISFLVELGGLWSASEKASGRLSVSGPPLNSGTALRSAALSWLIGAAALA
jgi:hypothetical protein